MFKKLVPLKKDEHFDLRLRRVDSMAFARSEIAAPIVIDEIGDVAREYPIVFPHGGKLPVALMGVEEGNNAYISPDGSWRATYIPAHIRHYPFALARIGDESGGANPGNGAADRQINLAVMVDVESPMISRAGGAPLFDDSGALSAAVQPIVDLMQQLAQRQALTQQMVAQLESAGLLSERTVRIQQPGKPEKHVTGLRMIDEKALNQLDDAAFSALRNAGVLPLIYAALLSWANFRQGPIGKSHPLPVQAEAGTDEILKFN
jgi:hypothetical protein